MDSDEDTQMELELSTTFSKGKGKGKAVDRELPAENDNLPWQAPRITLNSMMRLIKSACLGIGLRSTDLLTWMT